MTEKDEVIIEYDDLEEEVEEIEEEVPVKSKKKKSNTWKFVLVAVLLVCIGVATYFIDSRFNWTADRICKALTDLQTNLSQVTLEEDTDDAVSYFMDSVVKVEGVTYTGTIEVFENKTEALLKRDYYTALDTALMEVFNEKSLGVDLAQQYVVQPSTAYVNGNVLIRLSSHYTEYQAKQILKLFDQVMDKIAHTEKNIPDESKQTTIKKNYEKLIEEQVKEQKDNLIGALEGTLITLKAEVEQETDIDRLLEIKEEAGKFKQFAELGTLAHEVETAVDDKIKSQATAIDEILNEADETYSRDKIEEARQAIALLTHTVFDEYRNGWSARIDEILYRIRQKEIQDYKNQCEEYNYDYIDESDKGAYAYFEGRIERISTNSSGNLELFVSVTPKYIGDYIYTWDDLIVVDVDADINFAHREKDVIEMWGTLQGMVKHETLLGGGHVPAFYCKYMS